MPPKVIQIMLRGINNGWLSTIVISNDKFNINTGESFYPNLEKLIRELDPEIHESIVQLEDKESAPK